MPSDATATEETVLMLLRQVEDPEVPVNIVSLGLVQAITIDGGHVHVLLAPTYSACPGRAVIMREARLVLERAIGVGTATIEWSDAPLWTSERLLAAGRDSLTEFGVGVPDRVNQREAIVCPYCGSGETHLEQAFGTAVCKALHYCDACKMPFEALKGAW